jgi:hypothetical protein
VVIKASAAAEIHALIEALGGADDVMREAAIARLAVIGPRAVEKLVAAYRDAADAHARVTILRALEPIGDRRAAYVAQKAVAEGGDVAVAATLVLRGLLDSPHAEVATAALDALVATSLDRAAARHVRLAAFDALQDTSPGVRARVAEALASDPDVRLNGHAAQESEFASGDAFWLEIAAGRLPDDPRAIAAALHGRAGSAALTTLQKLIDAARERESAVTSAAARAEWRNLRGVLHQALARRGSKVALYDLRETLEETVEPLPVSFLAALQVLGDASCLEAVAAAYARAREEDAWWRQQLASAFQSICRRERLTRRHAVLKRVASRCPDLML